VDSNTPDEKRYQSSKDTLIKLTTIYVMAFLLDY